MNRLDREGSRDLLYGFGGGFASYSASVLTIKSSFYFFEKWGFPVENFLLSSNYQSLLRVINEIQSSFYRGVLKTGLISYLVVIGPLLEEWAFRGKLYECQMSQQSPPVRVLTNAVAFGAIHMNYFHGVASALYFLVATISGVIYACLREWTKGWKAPAIAHGISNACVIALETMR